MLRTYLATFLKEENLEPLWWMCSCVWWRVRVAFRDREQEAVLTQVHLIKLNTRARSSSKSIVIIIPIRNDPSCQRKTVDTRHKTSSSSSFLFWYFFRILKCKKRKKKTWIGNDEKSNNRRMQTTARGRNDDKALCSSFLISIETNCTIQIVSFFPHFYFTF